MSLTCGMCEQIVAREVDEMTAGRITVTDYRS